MSFKDKVLNEFDPLKQECSSDDDETSNVQENEKGNIFHYDDNMNNNNREHSIKERQNSIDDNEEPFYDFQLFLKQFKNPKAEPLVKYTRSFLNNFSTQRSLWSTSEQKKLINDFKLFIYDKFSLYEPFSLLDNTKLTNAQEGIEKLIMGKLYSQCFSPNLNAVLKLDEGHQNDVLGDEQLKSKIDEFKFITPEHLDIIGPIKGNLDKFVKISGRELSKINNFKSPRDKMVCVLNSCKVIFGILNHNRLNKTGADSFIPLLIYTIIKSDIDNLYSNIKYIERFRYDNFIRGESSYYISSLQAAVDFIIKLDNEQLTIQNSQEFNKMYDENKQTVLSKSTTKQYETINVEHNKLVISPSEYIVRPLDEAANSLLSRFNEIFISKEPQHEDSVSNVSNPNFEGEDVTLIAEMIEDQENTYVLESLQSMFPDIDKEIIQDICIAKKYRLGTCVDALLSISDG